MPKPGESTNSGKGESPLAIVAPASLRPATWGMGVPKKPVSTGTCWSKTVNMRGPPFPGSSAGTAASAGAPLRSALALQPDAPAHRSGLAGIEKEHAAWQTDKIDKIRRRGRTNPYLL